MKTNEAGVSLIKKWEGFVNHVYLCAAGYPTIGFGHVVLKGETFTTITEEEAEELLKKDLGKAERAVTRLIRVHLTENQFAALVSFTFNLGSGALQRSTMRIKLNRGEYEEVPIELMKWVWAGGKKLKGLQRRRKAEGDLWIQQ